MTAGRFDRNHQGKGGGVSGKMIDSRNTEIELMPTDYPASINITSLRCSTLFQIVTNVFMTKCLISAVQPVHLSNS